MKVSHWAPPAVFVLVLFGSVGVASATGTWVTGGRQEIVQGQRLAPDDIKGWMTLQQAADGLGIPVSTIIDLIGAPSPSALTPSTAFRDIETLVPGFELTTFRDKLRDR